jgi:hypothetical protein
LFLFWFRRINNENKTPKKINFGHIWSQIWAGLTPGPFFAVISGDKLLWSGKRYSMSSLAEKLLKEEGYSSNSVQGPTRWHNKDGVSIKQLWDQHLSGNA